MSKAVLALKWRPKDFSEVVGQEHILRPLIHALSTGKLHHSYLFSGTRGIGKTSLARIFARCLNCQKGVTAEPCGTCGPCTAILAGSFPGLIEVDAASRTQVTDTRELLETVSYSPMDGRYKVYLIDEVHMLSGHSFNALLKTLEEPPEHVCFLFATTDPERLPATIISRCLQFNLRTLGTAPIVEHLQKILKAEGVEAEEDAVLLLAEAARGSVRDALTLTDQAVAHGSGALKATEVATMLGTLDRATVQRILAAVSDGKGAELIAELDRVASLGADPATILEQLQRFLYEVALLQAVPGTEAEPAVQQLADKLDREEVQLYYQIALNSGRDLPQAPDLWTGLRMAALRLLSFAPGAPARSGKPADSAPSPPPAQTGDTAAEKQEESETPAPPPSSAAPTPEEQAESGHEEAGRESDKEQGANSPTAGAGSEQDAEGGDSSATAAGSQQDAKGGDSPTEAARSGQGAKGADSSTAAGSGQDAKSEDSPTEAAESRQDAGGEDSPVAAAGSQRDAKGEGNPAEVAGSGQEAADDALEQRFRAAPAVKKALEKGASVVPGSVRQVPQAEAEK